MNLKQHLSNEAAPNNATRMPPSNWNNGGFTLVEVLVVLTILALLATLFVTRGPVQNNSLEMRAAATEVVQALRRARGQAISFHRPVLVSIDHKSGVLKIDGIAAFTLAVSAVSARGNPDRIALDQQDIDVTFAPDGSSSGGQVELSNGRMHEAVAIDWLTGRIVVLRAP